MIALLHVHPTLEPQLTAPDVLTVEHIVPVSERENPVQLAVEEYIDSFGNCCSRFVAPGGAIRLSGTSVMNVSDQPDLQGFGLPQFPVEQLPADVLPFLLASRYYEVGQIRGDRPGPFRLLCSRLGACRRHPRLGS